MTDGALCVCKNITTCSLILSFTLPLCWLQSSLGESHLRSFCVHSRVLSGSRRWITYHCTLSVISHPSKTDVMIGLKRWLRATSAWHQWPNSVNEITHWHLSFSVNDSVDEFPLVCKVVLALAWTSDSRPSSSTCFKPSPRRQWVAKLYKSVHNSSMPLSNLKWLMSRKEASREKPVLPGTNWIFWWKSLLEPPLPR